MEDEQTTAEDFAAMYTEHRPRLEAIARRITGDRALAEDVVATAVARVWQRVSHDPPEEPIAYLVRAVQNEARDQLRRRTRAASREDRWAREAPPVTGASSLEDRDLLGRVLPLLPDAQRWALEMRYLHDLDDTEIAARLGVQPVTVRTLAHRGLHRLRGRMAHELAAHAAV